jgi:hypothetical protein
MKNPVDLDEPTGPPLESSYEPDERIVVRRRATIHAGRVTSTDFDIAFAERL